MSLRSDDQQPFHLDQLPRYNLMPVCRIPDLRNRFHQIIDEASESHGLQDDTLVPRFNASLSNGEYGTYSDTSAICTPSNNFFPFDNVIASSKSFASSSIDQHIGQSLISIRSLVRCFDLRWNRINLLFDIIFKLKRFISFDN